MAVPKIFINYRREDTAGHAGRLYDHLAREFGDANVFMDVDALEPGIDFVAELEKTLAECHALLAIIGPRWVSVTDRAGTPRLSSEDDIVRLEIEAALRRNIRIIPVLVEGAKMPVHDQVPGSLSALLRRHAIELTNSRWGYDVRRLVETLGRVQASASQQVTPSPAKAKPYSDPSPRTTGSLSMLRAITAKSSAALRRISDSSLRPDRPRTTATIPLGGRKLRIGAYLAVLASLLFIIFSVIFAVLVSNLEYPYTRSQWTDLHNVIAAGSLIYFGSYIVFCIADLKRRSGSGSGKQRSMPIIAMSICFIMSAWAILMATSEQRIGFLEVVLAWIAAGLVLGLFGLYVSKRID
jgi:hypothetical protein